MRIHYRETGDGIEIVRCFGTDGKIELPGMIGGRPVTRAAAYAFSGRKDHEDEDVLVRRRREGSSGSRSSSWREKPWRVCSFPIR